MDRGRFPVLRSGVASCCIYLMFVSSSWFGSDEETLACLVLVRYGFLFAFLEEMVVKYSCAARRHRGRLQKVKATARYSTHCDSLPDTMMVNVWLSGPCLHSDPSNNGS